MWKTPPYVSPELQRGRCGHNSAKLKQWWSIGFEVLAVSWRHVNPVSAHGKFSFECWESEERKHAARAWCRRKLRALGELALSPREVTGRALRPTIKGDYF